MKEVQYLENFSQILSLYSSHLHKRLKNKKKKNLGKKSGRQRTYQSQIMMWFIEQEKAPHLNFKSQNAAIFDLSRFLKMRKYRLRQYTAPA